MSERKQGLRILLLEELMRDAHRYSPGIEQPRPSMFAGSPRGWRQARTLARERSRDLAERIAARAGFVHRHFEPDDAAVTIERLLTLGEGLERTYSLLADDSSRRALVDVLKLRVLGPYHASLRITPQAYRAKQAFCERQLCVQRSTIEVSDPWFSPLSLYRIPVHDGPPITLHSHSVDVVCVFLLEQYSYLRGAEQVRAKSGHVVLDIGGCWGDTALYFANLVGPRGRVYTFEFDPESLEVLRANLELNPHLAERIEVVERAAWNRSRQEVPFRQAGRMTSISGEPAGAERRVETVTVDDFILQAGIERLSLVKMDVEGSELTVLKGARQTLNELAPSLAISAYHRDDDLVEIPRKIEELNAGYRLYLDTFSPVEEETVLFATAVNSST